jgi:hypothetical protein
VLVVLAKWLPVTASLILSQAARLGDRTAAMCRLEAPSRRTKGTAAPKISRTAFSAKAFQRSGNERILALKSGHFDCPATVAEYG